MGFSVSWLAVKGKDSESVLVELELLKTSQYKDFPESDIVGAILPNDWYLIALNDCCSEYVEEDVLRQLSEHCELIATVVEEHVMYSMAQYWKNGSRVWQITHDAQQSTLDLVHTGELPDSYESIKSECMREQEEDSDDEYPVDYIFEIPLLVAQEYVGYKHDEDFFDEEGKFTILKSTKEPTQAWWKFW